MNIDTSFKFKNSGMHFSIVNISNDTKHLNKVRVGSIVNNDRDTLLVADCDQLMKGLNFS